MGLKKIADLPRQQFCRHPEHNPPGHIVLSPGVYEHTCPGCKSVFRFSVHPTHMAVGGDHWEQATWGRSTLGGIAYPRGCCHPTIE